MKAIILAAGKGTRLNKYTKDLPKGMLEFQGKTIIERQLSVYRECGIKEISIVRGYAAERINYPNVNYYTNTDYENTNMVESLMAAENEFNDDIIVSYSDILFEHDMLKAMIDCQKDYVVAVDEEWKYYWQMRYGRIDYDTESLSINKKGNIVELGLENPKIDAIDARYIGLLKFSKRALNTLTGILDKAYELYGDQPWQQSGKPIRKAYMTDLLNAAIEAGEEVYAKRFKHGWLEFDTNEDYENACTWAKEGSIINLIKL